MGPVCFHVGFAAQQLLWLSAGDNGLLPLIAASSYVTAWLIGGICDFKVARKEIRIQQINSFSSVTTGNVFLFFFFPPYGGCWSWREHPWMRMPAHRRPLSKHVGGRGSVSCSWVIGQCSEGVPAPLLLPAHRFGWKLQKLRNEILMNSNLKVPGCSLTLHLHFFFP